MRIPRRNPLNYDLCTDTITVYRKEGDTYARTVYEKAFFDYKKVQNVDKLGTREANSALIVIPVKEQPTPIEGQPIFEGDKVVYGNCPTIISTPQEWGNFIPAKVPGMVVVSFVDSKRWNGEIVHWEAGG